MNVECNHHGPSIHVWPSFSHSFTTEKGSKQEQLKQPPEHQITPGIKGFFFVRFHPPFQTFWSLPHKQPTFLACKLWYRCLTIPAKNRLERNEAHGTSYQRQDGKACGLEKCGHHGWWGPPTTLGWLMSSINSGVPTLLALLLWAWRECLILKM